MKRIIWGFSAIPKDLTFVFYTIKKKLFEFILFSPTNSRKPEKKLFFLIHLRCGVLVLNKKTLSFLMSNPIENFYNHFSRHTHNTFTIHFRKSHQQKRFHFKVFSLKLNPSRGEREYIKFWWKIILGSFLAAFQGDILMQILDWNVF